MPLLRRPAVLVLIGFVLLSFNTRAPYGQIGPLAPVAGLDPATVMILGVIPPLGMGLAAPFVPMLMRRGSVDRLLLAASVAALIGALLRPIEIGGLIAGTIVSALAIGVVNVLIPVFIRHRFHHRSGGMFGAYALAMGLGSALAAAVVVPTAHATGHWELGVATAIVPAVLAVLGSIALLERRPSVELDDPGHALASPSEHIRVKGTWLAWSLLAFFGIQTLLFCGLLAWLPSILVAAGSTPGAAGMAQAVLIVGIALGGFAAPLLAAGSRQQTGVIALVIGFCSVGLLGMALLPSASAWLWVPLLGMGLGGGQALPGILCAHRGASPAHTASLSSFAQTGGFLVAATGPLLLKGASQLMGGWTIPLGLLSIGCAANLALSWRAGTDPRPAEVEESPEPALAR